MDRRIDVRHFVHRRSCDISSSNMAAYERWPRVSARGTKYSSEVCRMSGPRRPTATAVSSQCLGLPPGAMHQAASPLSKANYYSLIA